MDGLYGDGKETEGKLGEANEEHRLVYFGPSTVWMLVAGCWRNICRWDIGRCEHATMVLARDDSDKLSSWISVEVPLTGLRSLFRLRNCATFPAH